LLNSIRKSCEANPDKIRRFEIPQGIVITVEEWTDLNKVYCCSCVYIVILFGKCMTPSMKIKREGVREKYKDEIAAELDDIERRVSSNGKKTSN
jgi:long-subunit acyl-CoA synthetase (AMP-forming)